MAVICRACGKRLEISLPPVRTRKAPCDVCGNQDEVKGGRTEGMNFDYPDNLMPNSPRNPNVEAEREQNRG